ncbi:unnamed protein product [Mytilus coruscus]|uniref:B box-type domain-containing protein n=1 Tax=Mytilus coruscus TaxID=42192 RepID=A0A6J8EVE1_MYTCO|nr:unnamed protein product [Mytilus coruscus]
MPKPVDDGNKCDIEDIVDDLINEVLQSTETGPSLSGIVFDAIKDIKEDDDDQSETSVYDVTDIELELDEVIDEFCDQQNVKWKCEDCGVYLCNACKEKIHPRLKVSDKHRIVSIQDIGKNSNQAASQPIEEDIMNCPISNTVCPDLNSLQMHVLDCMDK